MILSSVEQKNLEKYGICSGIYFLGGKKNTTWWPRKIRPP
jgi:hypothetical protein